MFLIQLITMKWILRLMLEGGKHVNISCVVISKKTNSFKDFYEYSAFFHDRVKKKKFFFLD